MRATLFPVKQRIAFVQTAKNFPMPLIKLYVWGALIVKVCGQVVEQNAAQNQWFAVRKSAAGIDDSSEMVNLLNVIKVLAGQNGLKSRGK